MIRLETFGGLDLRDSRGRVVTAVLAKPQLMAMLVYLAYSRPGAFRRRDGLIALFWPDHADEPARHNLRQALYGLRRGLGDAVILSRGNEEVGVSETALDSDVRDFRVAVRESRWDEALRLYRGPFLDGFHLPRVPELQHWIDEERGALSRMAFAAASNASEESLAVGDLERADGRARRALQIMPHSEPALRRVIEVLLQKGDRAGAIDLFGRFAGRLASEYGLEPSRETIDLIASARRGPKSRGSS